MADFVAQPEGGMTEKGSEQPVNQAAPAETAEEIAAEEAAKKQADDDAKAKLQADAEAAATAATALRAKADELKAALTDDFDRRAEGGGESGRAVGSGRGVSGCGSKGESRRSAVAIKKPGARQSNRAGWNRRNRTY